MDWLYNLPTKPMFIGPIEEFPVYAGPPKPTGVCTLEELVRLKIIGVYEKIEGDVPKGYQPLNYSATQECSIRRFRPWEL